MRIMILSDEPLFRQAFQLSLRRRAGDVDVCVVDDVAGALRCLENHEPGLVAVDLTMHEVQAAGALERLTAGRTAIVIDRRPVAAHAARARSAGARAYVAKTMTPELIEAALGVVFAGGEYYPAVAGAAPGAADDPTDWKSRLTARQANVLRLLLEGKTNREIAADLGVSVPTAKLHVQSILRTAGARNRIEAVVKAGGGPA